MVNKKILVFVLSLLSLFSFSQNFTLKELINLVNLNSEEFDTYVTKKGYYSYKTNTKDNGDFVQRVYTIGNTQRIDFTTMKNEDYSSGVCWTTNSKQGYLSIKEALKKNNFVFSEEININSITIYYYKTDQYELSLAPSVVIQNDKELHFYEINLLKYSK